MSFKKVGVIGAGQMGAGIAQVFAHYQPVRDFWLHAGKFAPTKLWHVSDFQWDDDVVVNGLMLAYDRKRDGLIRAKWHTPPTGKKRKVYAITAEGRRVHERRISEWVRFTDSVNAILRENSDA